jgi:hypothetical protein
MTGRLQLHSSLFELVVANVEVSFSPAQLPLSLVASTTVSSEHLSW